MKRAYISSHDRLEALAAADRLRGLGYDIVSTWHDETGPWHDPNADVSWWRERLGDNRRKIARADVLVLLSGPDRYPGGKFIEAALAHALGIPVFVVGRFENGMIAGFATRITTVAELPV